MGNRGCPKGTKLKPVEDLHPHRAWMNFTDAQYDFLCDICTEYHLTLAKATRMCIDIVGDMKQSEFDKIARSKIWK